MRYLFRYHQLLVKRQLVPYTLLGSDFHRWHLVYSGSAINCAHFYGTLETIRSSYFYKTIEQVILYVLALPCIQGFVCRGKNQASSQNLHQASLQHFMQERQPTLIV